MVPKTGGSAARWATMLTRYNIGDFERPYLLLIGVLHASCLVLGQGQKHGPGPHVSNQSIMPICMNGHQAADNITCRQQFCC